MEPIKIQTEFAGRNLSLSTGRIALQADGAVTVRYGDTVVLSTGMMSEEGPENADFFRLTVDFLEKYYAAGKIKGSRFIKRDGRPSEEAILKARLIDRPVRPLFPKGITNEVQIINTVLSADLENEPGVLAITGTSCALLLAGMPFAGPIAGVRIGMVDDELIVMPTAEQIENGKLDLVVAGTADAITMVEAGANEVTEEQMLQALQLAHDNIKTLCEFQMELVKQVNPEAREYTIGKASDEATEAVAKVITKEDLDSIQGVNKKEVKKAHKAVTQKLLEAYAAQIEDETYSEGELKGALQKAIDTNMRQNILEHGRRVDGRSTTEVRPVSCAVDLLPRTHGSALFQRGETQALTLTTLGGPGAAQIIDTMDIDVTKRYFHHYNFPPFSVGDIKFLRSASRREIGHGFLAERALVPMLPTAAEFPYTIHVVSEIMTCNGSSSMASVCGSTMSLMAAGVPIKKPVAGIAMGLVVTDEFKESGSGAYKILSDIQGLEDFAGDMDFKVTGTNDGITALQMDIKVKGITVEMMKEALDQAKSGRDEIMAKMIEAIPAYRDKLSDFAPLILSIQIDPEKIRDVIGKGGETIQKITAECGVEMDIEQDGVVTITAPDGPSGEKARAWVDQITRVPEAGEVFEGKVVKIMDFGAFVEFLPGKDGLVHISKLRPFRVENVSDVVSEGDIVKVRLEEIDSQGRYNLTMKEFYDKKDAPQAGSVNEDSIDF